HRFIEQETLFYFRDISDHVVHLLDAVSMLRDSANALMELYMSGVSNRMNEVMKVLTIISTIFIPGTFIAGVYGMNFAHMPELEVPWAYPLVLGVMAVVAIGMVVFFRRRRWF
ncbi:MAG: CorA family divalent cation transporter, partial [Spirochaetota bacterium]